MITKDDMVRIFGQGNVRTFSPAALEDVALSNSTKNMLTDVGLPYKADLMLTFDFDANYLPTLDAFAQMHGCHAPKHSATTLRIGTDYGTQLCIDPHGHDALISIDIEGNGIPDRLVNSSVKLFLESLAVYYKFKGAGIGMTQEKVKELAMREEEELMTLDAAAFASSESWWPLVVEQIKDRLL